MQSKLDYPIGILAQESKFSKCPEWKFSKPASKVLESAGWMMPKFDWRILIEFRRRIQAELLAIIAIRLRLRGYSLKGKFFAKKQ